MLERQIERTSKEIDEQSDIPAKVLNIMVFPTCVYW